ncbi:uncharacterized protein [Epargyreus clarus]|uniref:uncharacterized protein n=1 Tax=Epargyreus clarus TaxID=520877 RepID=UPI003C2AEBCA
MQELVTKQAMKECGVCKEREQRIRKYEQEIEREKIVQCQMALEREKIAKGMQCTKADEIRLKEMQKMQIEEKKIIEEEAEEVDRMWHQVLLDTVKMKEQYERHEAERLKQEMVERRLFYDEQIASANKKRREAIKHEREVENRRLENMKKKMEEDYFDAIKRKKDQQQKNKHNFIEGHEMKLSRIRREKQLEREIDNKTIRTAIEELQKERQQMKNQIQTLQIEKQVCVNNFYREKKMAEQLAQETDNIIREWEEKGQKETEKMIRNEEVRKYQNKMNGAQDYRRHIEVKRQEMERARQERVETMDRVKKTAFAELRRNLDSANEEMRRQIQYRQNLTSQIHANRRVLETELNSIECKQRPFTKKAVMFKDAMGNFINHSRDSTNPMHPFTRIMQLQGAPSDKCILPSINK